MNKKFLGLFYGNLNEIEVEILDCLEENVEELIISEIEKDYCRKNFKLGAISVENYKMVYSIDELGEYCYIHIQQIEIL